MRQPEQRKTNDMQDYLHQIDILVLQGQNHEDQGRHEEAQGLYATALERHVWFHTHALEHEPGMCGVRLSFALYDWRMLGDLYKPALDRLKLIRDTKTAAIRNHTAPLHPPGADEESDNNYLVDLFNDVESINRVLDEGQMTIGLFRDIHQCQPTLASECWDNAKEALLEHGEFSVIANYLDSVDAYNAEFEAQLAHYNCLIDSLKWKPAEEDMERLKDHLRDIEEVGRDFGAGHSGNETPSDGCDLPSCQDLKDLNVLENGEYPLCCMHDQENDALEFYKKSFEDGIELLIKVAENPEYGNEEAADSLHQKLYQHRHEKSANDNIC